MTSLFEDQMEENAALLQRVAPSPLSRRKILLGGGAAALGLVAAACGSDEDPFVLEDPPDPNLTVPPPNQPAPGGGGDVETAKLAAGLEVLAVNTYQGALDAAGQGALGEVPPAVATFATTARDHHQAHLQAWNDLLTSLGEQPVNEPLPALAGPVGEQFGQVSDVGGVARLALMLEQTAASTYFDAIPSIANPQALELATTIQPIDMQHAAVLLYVLGEYPVPDTFADADESAIPS
jgi:hypothetical protein